MSDRSSRDFLAELIGFATVSRDPNKELIHFIRDYLATFGIESELFFNEEGTKANLFATIGPQDQAGVILSGHTDVVPVDGQTWTVPPFELTEQEGRLYGRGTADMKGFIACVLAAVPTFVAADLKTPIHLAFSYDEEIGCLGVRPMLAALAERQLDFKLCLIGEPTELQPILGHKGKLAMRCEVQGAACHSAYAPYGVNAIEYASKLVVKLLELGQQYQSAAHQDERFDPPFSTVQTGLIKGGSALNIVPSDCEFDFEIRALPGFDMQQIPDQLQRYIDQELLPTMQAVEANTSIELSTLSEYPGLVTAPDSEAAQLLAQLTGSTEFGTVAFGTEGGLFNELGIPTVVCGPGSMDQGHKPDEFVSLDQLQRCDELLQRLAAHLAK